MEFILLLIAFVCGFACKFVNLPPLIGYLIAGFILNALGFSSNPTLQTIADLGITVMLFTIGLKLNIKDLIKPEIWFASIAHSTLWISFISLFMFIMGVAGLSYFAELSMFQLALIGFAFSFSSTVCVVKILEESGETRTRHGKVAIGILIMQDIFAVVFLVLATGKVPSIYALALFALIPLAPLLKRFVAEAGHGELLPLCGLVCALGGYHLFELVGVKGDLGALIIGVLLAGNAKSSELAKSLLSFKDLFLIGFFLSIGLTALPNLEMTLIALLLTAVIPVKFVLFFALFTQLRLRARTSYLSSLIMSNYSEFGLIVAAVAVTSNMITDEWLVIIAMSVSFSFVISSILYKQSHEQYQRFKLSLRSFQKHKPLPEDAYPSFKDVDVLVIGMGRVGKGAFTALTKVVGPAVCGMDADEDKVRNLRQTGHNAIVGDGENIDLWENLNVQDVKLVLLALPSIEDSANVTEQLRMVNYNGKIAAIARYEDEVQPLLDKGVDQVFNFFTDAGLGFAEESLAILDEGQITPQPAVSQS
ncbi:cation:proton antiporter [Glaciecola sp. XM2]|jgi:predicted Kef-type K+ transport protein|uniref:cation:proton antiporter family protein n=1 Tax=Glaciecola sp. XM2 TaxID=1914931 RepID=UPI001BDF6781|nr:cation:proton antiporter family protein [Glaciecola sp. XM2]MBT1449647.1 cation:proton antiporter [Glaciecola sp. XM2]